MTFIIKDRVKEGTTTTGTGAITLGGASSTFDPFNSYMTNGDTSYYALVHTTTGADEWEVGLGTWNTGNTLTRTTILSGSNGTSPVDFSAGTKEVFMTYPASKAVALDASGALSLPDGLSVMGVIDGATSLEVETHIDLNTTELNKPAHNEGRIFYDAAFGALAVYNDEADITLQVGQEEYIRVKNNSGATITNGTPVYLTGEDASTPTIAVARADGTYNASQAVGVATHDIENNTVGYITVRGLIADVDTSHLTVGERVHVAIGASGGTQTAAPSYPYYATNVGICLISSASGGCIYVAVETHAFETLRVTGNSHFDANVTIDGDLTVLGTQTIANSENIALSGAFNYFNSGDTIGDANTAFTGAGLDDAVLTGHYEGTTTNKSFYVKINATGTPDTFSWSTDNFATTEATGVAITGADQALEDGISVAFNATTGHTVGDVWNGSASPVNVDSGIASNRNTGTSGVGYTHMGMYYDVSTNKWTFFDEYDPEPEGNIDTTDSSFSLATIKAGTFEGDLDGNVTGDVTGNVAGNVTGSLTGNVTGNVTGSSGSSTGNAATATKLATARTVQLTGDVTGSATFDGSANISINASVQDDSHAHTIGNVDGLQTALDSKAPTSRVITAGNGLTGGGDLTANRTFTVGGGTGVTVNANGIAIGQDVATTATPTFAGLTTTANIAFGDNDKAIFGAGSDLQIYHSGTHSYIDDGGTGNLYVRATNFRINNAGNTQQMFSADDGGAVMLFNNGGMKLATTSTGIDVTGTVTADGLTVNGNADVSGHVDVGNAYSLRWGDGNERITGNNTGLLDAFTNNTKRLNINSGGDISFFDATGTTAKFFWDASAEHLNVGGSTNYDYDINAGDDGIGINSTGVARFVMRGSEFRLQGVTNSPMTFRTNNAERMRIDNNGNVGIGTTTPSMPLSLDGNMWFGNGNGTEIGTIENNGGWFDFGGSTNVYGAQVSATSVVRTVVNNIERMRVTNAGNVGIGTPAPNRKLTVLGGVAGFGNGAIETIISYSDRGIVGTQSNHPLALRSNGVDRVHIDTSGNVGIGTSSPATALDVTGTITTDGLTVGAATRVDIDGNEINMYNSNYYLASVNTDDADNTNGLTLESGFNGDILFKGYNGLTSSTKGGGVKRFFIEGTSGDISFYDDSGTTPKFYWDAVTERLGIGTTSPTEKLQVAGRILSTSGGFATTGTVPLNLGYDQAGGATIGYTSAGNLEFVPRTNYNSVFPSGNVGIGTSSPTTKLEVVGAVKATSFEGDGSALTGIEGVPAGVVIYHAANTAPTGFIKANGASLSTTTYANLFAAIGYTFGGSGSSFNVPDLRGEFIRGWDDGRGADSGRGFGSYQGHDSRALNRVQYSTASSTAVSVSTSGALSGAVRTGSGTGYGLRFRLSTAETRPRNRALLACIKY